MAESGGSLMASFVQPLVAGSAGGCGAVLAGHPFETIKARIAPTAGHLRWWRGDYSVFTPWHLYICIGDSPYKSNSLPV
jgi:hypothetical protein